MLLPDLQPDKNELQIQLKMEAQHLRACMASGSIIQHSSRMMTQRLRFFKSARKCLKLVVLRYPVLMFFLFATHVRGKGGHGLVARKVVSMDICTALFYNAELRQRHWPGHTDNCRCAEPICIPTAASGCLSALCPGKCMCTEACLNPLSLLERLGAAESLGKLMPERRSSKVIRGKQQAWPTHC